MTARTRIVAIAVLGALALFGSVAESASACSCAAEPITAETFRESDAALIGRLRERVAVNEYEHELRYRVRRVFRGRRVIEAGSTVRVRTSAQGSACGIETREGGRDGLFLSRGGGRWQGGLCSTTGPREMRRAAKRAGFARTRACGS